MNILLQLALPVETGHEHEEATHVLNHAENKFYKHKTIEENEDDDDDFDIDDDDDDDDDDDFDDDDDIDVTEKPVVIADTPILVSCLKSSQAMIFFFLTLKTCHEVVVSFLTCNECFPFR